MNLPSPYLERQALIQHFEHLGLFTPTVQDAIDLAERVHRGQRRDDGLPYPEEHIFPVGAGVGSYTVAKGWTPADASQGVIIGLLHDTIEDSPTLRPADLERQFGQEIAAAVVTLSKPDSWYSGGWDSDEREYVVGILKAPLVVRVVKMFDRMNNLACIHKSHPSKRHRYLDETARYYVALAHSTDEEFEGAIRQYLAGKPRVLYGLWAEWLP